MKSNDRSINVFDSSFGEVHMKKFHVLATALAAAALLAGCGGNEAGDQSPRVKFTQMVNFGDSLSDVGSYNVGAVALQGGGYFSINGAGATGLLHTNWTEFLAGTLQLTQPCAAETGLNTIQAIVGVPPVAATFHDTGSTPCLNYAQGGARVTNPVGPGNANLVTLGVPSTYSNALGALTIPVHTQIQNYLADVSPTFSSGALVTVLAGANDVFINVATVQAQIAGGVPPATAVGGAVTAMTLAADQLADDINTNILGKGATHVVVINVPDISVTPSAIASGASGQALVKQLVQAYNNELTSKLTASASLLYIDSYTAIEDEVANPAQYGLSNVDTAACTSSSSLVCTKATLIAAVTPSPLTNPATAANTYLFADSVHPTPFGYRLLAELVGEKLAIKGWL
jgi:outer membrane lipase/esterase